ncbi:DNA-binding MarR family transcriptional regulator [Breznakia sp. PF5-3]|uniref:MarR family winged helix-turn-helix transcriptional regulator n=1 Tax=unclassified Breznakia TaxID=2623764 RepID=UPI00240682E8|nr:MULTISPECIES: MarR family transcriptional regulator [unclassified Breznakia]MDF9824643.1 DNA-binding MarR family transcriptional regulator [Breznakia sp. PM6-1]MDF9835628.1 DNA-binding MarR family transcriptional regulator [Breznakia sp. PF5-3]MDF9837707.1 DNA-binding MarR family transcriptional regulator [Breznakia sp. PFB2-8]MDF9859571.1 DNA-binding MarR family transcriptional regulator [Breznakia sp. PH5-24]
MDVTLIEKCERLSAETNELAFALMRPFYEEYGINYLKLSVLREISKSDSITLNMLANKLSKAAANLSVVITTMEEEGYVKRTRSVNDKRITFIQIDKKGKEISEKSYNYIAEVFDNVLSNGNELDVLVKALEDYRDKLLTAIEK